MRILVAGAGPAGLYLSYLFKKKNPRCEVRVVEQNRADSTFGFGVVFSDRALEFLRGDDPATSVVDGYGRSHDVPNLFIMDGSVFVTSSSVNPTPTIAAFAARATEHLIETAADQEVPL